MVAFRRSLLKSGHGYARVPDNTSGGALQESTAKQGKASPEQKPSIFGAPKVNLPEEDADTLAAQLAASRDESKALKAEVSALKKELSALKGESNSQGSSVQAIESKNQTSGGREADRMIREGGALGAALKDELILLKGSLNSWDLEKVGDQGSSDKPLQSENQDVESKDQNLASEDKKPSGSAPKKESSAPYKRNLARRLFKTLKRNTPSNRAPSNEALSNEAPSNEAPSNEAPSNEAPSNEAPPNEESSSEKPSNEEPSSEEPSSEEPSSEEPSSEEPSSEEPSSEEPSSEEPSNEAPPSEEPSNKEPSNEEPSNEETSKGLALNRLPTKKSPRKKASFLELPTEVVAHVVGFMPPVSAISFSMTCKRYYLAYFPDWPSLDAKSTETLLTMLEKDVPDLLYCSKCTILHHWRLYPHSKMLYMSGVFPSQSCRYDFQLNSPTYRDPLDYQTARLAMNYHFYGPSHGFPLEMLAWNGEQGDDQKDVLVKTTQQARIVDDELFLRISRKVRNPKGGMKKLEKFLREDREKAICFHHTMWSAPQRPSTDPAASASPAPVLNDGSPAPMSLPPFLANLPLGVVLSCPVCLVDAEIKASWYGTTERWSVIIETWTQVGACRSPSDPKWRFTEHQHRKFNVRKAEPTMHPAGSVKRRWAKGDDEDLSEMQAYFLT